MNKEEAVSVMLESINADNKELCLQTGMSEEEANKNICKKRY